MKEQFVTYEIALKLKELGFNELCIAGFNSYKILKHNIASVHGDENDYISISKYDNKLLAPLWQQAIDWLDSKNIFIDITYHKSGKFYASVNNECDIPITDDLAFEKYDNRNKASEQAILKALEIITNK